MIEKKFVTAQEMGIAVSYDPQFSMPARPRFMREVVIVPLSNGLLFDGTDEQQILRGRATINLLPQLLPLLDGTRGLEQVSAALPHVPSKAIHNAVALLYTRGLLEDSAADPVAVSPASFDEQTLAFFRRHVDVTRVNQSALQAAERLTRAQVLVCASGPKHAETKTHVANLLLESGVGSVIHAALRQDMTLEFEARPGSKLIVVMITGDEDHAALQRLDDECARLNIPWLRAAVSPESSMAEIGPYFERGETACYGCFTKVQNEFPSSVGGEETWLHTRFWASMLATEAIYLLSRIAPPVTVPTLARYRLDSWKMQRLHIPKSHDCVNCYLPRGLAPGSMEDLEPAKGVPPNLTAVFYEDAVSLPSRHLINPKGHQAHYRTVNVEKTYEGKRYLDAEQVALPSYEQLPQLEGSTLEHLRAMDSERLSHETLNLINLTALLLFSAGVRPIDGSMPGKLRRWSPTGGNLGSVELYVAASQVEGLDPGIYFYQPREHTLARLSQSKRQADVIDFIEQVAPDEHRDGDGALIIMVAAHHRVLSKYGAFAYRIINLDAGVALGQLHMVGSSLGLKTHTVRRWADDIIADRLNLEAINEGVTGALLVREAGK